MKKICNDPSQDLIKKIDELEDTISNKSLLSSNPIKLMQLLYKCVFSFAPDLFTISDLYI